MNYAPGLGFRLLTFSRVRLAAALAGIAVAVIVMLVELGLLTGILESQSLMATLVRGDLVVVDAARTNLHKWNSLSRIRLNQIAGFANVERVIPVYQGTMGLYDPETRAVRRIVVVAFPAGESPLDIGDPAEIAAALRVPNTVLFDRLSRPIYAEIVPGREIELDGLPFRAGGFVDVGPDIVNDGTVVMSDGTYFRRFPNAQPIMGVIRLGAGAGAEAARDAMAESLPDDVAIFTPDELRAREIDFTLRSAPIGILFGIGMLAGLVIGSITCYQILFNEIVDRLKQYATLKAMGFSDLFLRGVILEQALLLSWGGFIAGLAAAWATYGYIAARTALAVEMSLPAAALIFVLTTGMSVVAGLLALRRVAAADPAELY